MKVAVTERLAASLAEPLNNAIQSANGAQFALMLSLALEARAGRQVDFAPAVVGNNRSTPSDAVPVRLDHAMSVALQTGEGAAFNLYHCLYQECPIKQEITVQESSGTEEFPAVFDRRGRGQEMINEIENAKQQSAYLSAA